MVRSVSLQISAFLASSLPSLQLAGRALSVPYFLLLLSAGQRFCDMAAGSTMYYPQLRKLDFPLIKCPGGVPDALRRHREAVSVLLGPDGMIPPPQPNPSYHPVFPKPFHIADHDIEIEPAEPYAGTSLALPDSPVLQSIFDFASPLPSPSPSSVSGPESAPSSPPPVTAAAHSGTDAETLRLVEVLARGQRRSSRRDGARLMPRDAALEREAEYAPSPPPAKKRKCVRCADDEEEAGKNGRDSSSSSSPPPPAKKQRRALPSASGRTIPAPAPAPPSAPVPTPASPAKSLAQRAVTTNGPNIGQPLPASLQQVANYINALPRLGSSGWPSRNRMRKADETATEVSRKSGYLMTDRRGGRLRGWFGDEAVFGRGLWRWLVGEQDF